MNTHTITDCMDACLECGDLFEYGQLAEGRCPACRARAVDVAQQRMTWPVNYACVCAARVNDPYWQDLGSEQIMRRCHCCDAPVVVKVRTLEAIQSMYPGRWDLCCVECYASNRAPVEICLP